MADRKNHSMVNPTPAFSVKPPPHQPPSPRPNKFDTLKDQILIQINMALEEKSLERFDLKDELRKLARRIVSEKQKNDNEHLKWGRIRNIMFEERNKQFTVVLAHEVEEIYQAEESAFAQLSKLVEKELAPILLAIKSYKSQLTFCRDNLKYLTFREGDPDYETNMTRLLSYVKTAEQTAEEYHLTLSRSEFFNNPKFKRLLSEGLPKVKFMMDQKPSFPDRRSFDRK